MGVRMKKEVSTAEYRAYWINRIKGEYKAIRQEAKPATFALQYGGTCVALMDNCGFDKDEAIRVYDGYHKLYKQSLAYRNRRMKQASKDGYVTVAFGLRVRTPLLSQVVYGTRSMPREAQAEGRTAGNALGQSYGLLNNRAAVAFFEKVWRSPYRTRILPSALIHDAIYIIMEDTPEVVAWANKELIKAMEWQELPELVHPAVKLGAELDIYWPSWAEHLTLPNDAGKEELVHLVQKYKEKQHERED